MNIHKVAFIICSNDEQETDECIFYIKNLKIPKGYSVEIIPIYNAVSMAAGYNIGMNRGDANYKIYLHQDTFIINPNFIYDLLEVFKSDLKIGLLGIVGRTKMPLDGVALDGWNAGKVYDNLEGIQGFEGGICEVDALDGLLLATQYDIPWREDLFQGWDYYDISQCYEFHRKGLKVVVPEQKEYWCYHDNRYSRLKDYDKWREKFVEEYKDVYPFQYTDHISDHELEMEKLSTLLINKLDQNLDNGEMEEFSEICRNQNVADQLWAKEYCQIDSIYCLENAKDSSKKIYQGNAKDTLKHLRLLKHLLKRIEYAVPITDRILSTVLDEYSVYAICIVCISYCKNREKVFEKLLHFCRIQNRSQEECSLFFYHDVMRKSKHEDVRYMHPLVMQDEVWKVKGRASLLLIADYIGKETPKLMALCRELCEKYDIFLVVQSYGAEVLEQLDQMHAETWLLDQPAHLIWEMRDKLYKQFSQVVIVGNEMESFVELWHRTYISVTWYVSKEKKDKVMQYSDNIRLCVWDEIVSLR